MSFTEFGLTDKESSTHREALNKQSMGNKKYKNMIDSGSREADKKNLPFTFSKPKKDSPRTVTCWCTECGSFTRVSKTTVMVICAGCGSLYSVTEDNKR